MLMFLALALLQAETQTDCTRMGNTVQCKSTTTQPLDYGTILRNSRDASPGYQRPDPSVLDAARDRNNRRYVGKLVNAGKCDEAVSFALKQGDLDLASEVKAYCAK